jgi:hypothetical protein
MNFRITHNVIVNKNIIIILSDSANSTDIYNIGVSGREHALNHL